MYFVDNHEYSTFTSICWTIKEYKDMAERVRVLKSRIEDKDWMNVSAEIPCDVLMGILERYMDLSGKVIHLDLPSGKKAVILCVENGTLIEVGNKVSGMTDAAFVDMFEEVFSREDEFPKRRELIEFLTEATSCSAPVIIEYIID